MVDVVEMAEFRSESRSDSLAIWETRLVPDDGGSLLRTASVPLGSRDSLWGKWVAGDEMMSALAYRDWRWDTGVFVWLRSSLRGCRCRLVAERLALLRYRSAMRQRECGEGRYATADMGCSQWL
jgi:hypothetical protein